MSQIKIIYGLFALSLLSSLVGVGRSPQWLELVSLGAAGLAIASVWTGRGPARNKGDAAPTKVSWALLSVEDTPDTIRHMRILRAVVVLILAAAVLSSFQWLTYFDRYAAPLPFNLPFGLNTVFQTFHLLLWSAVIGLLIYGAVTGYIDSRPVKPSDTSNNEEESSSE